MKYLHTMVRISDIEESLDFYCKKLGLVEQRRFENESGRYTLIFVAAPGNPEAAVELTYNWDPERLQGRAQLRPPRLRGRRHSRRPATSS